MNLFQSGILGFGQLIAFLVFFLVSIRVGTGGRFWAFATGNVFFLYLLGPNLVALALVSAFVLFVCARGVQSQSGTTKSLYLWGGVAWCFGLLTIAHVPALRSDFSAHASFSYFSLLLLGFLLDAYWGRVKFAYDWKSFSLASTFFPIFASGPIERAETLLPQFQRLPEFDYAKVREGAMLLFTGMTKKIVIASALLAWIEPYFQTPSRYHPLALAAALLLARYWLYWDFSGYTDMARGAAAMFGIEVRPNFHRPFRATNLLDFWSRWHISLTTWIRDYVYHPLLVGPFRHLGLPVFVMICFILLGLWHGITWGFLIFGLYEGAAVLVQTFLSRKMDRTAFFVSPGVLRLRRISGALITLGFFVSLPMVFFMTKSAGDAFHYLSSFGGGGSEWHLPPMDFRFFGIVGGLFISMAFPGRHDVLAGRPALLRWSGYFLWVLYFFVFGHFELATEFAYIRF